MEGEREPGIFVYSRAPNKIVEPHAHCLTCGECIVVAERQMRLLLVLAATLSQPPLVCCEECYAHAKGIVSDLHMLMDQLAKHIKAVSKAHTN